MRLMSITEVLLFPENNPNTWLYLPPDQAKWNLATLGVFSLDSYDFPPDSDEYLPGQAKTLGWVEILDKATIEEVVANVKAQLDAPSVEQLFQAFVFYYENDAFLGFENRLAEMMFKDVENESVVPRLGGYSFLPENIDWPSNPKGDKLTLALSLPTDFLNQVLSLNLPKEYVLSVFTTYEKEGYFLDVITFHGDKEELENIKKGFTRVLLHQIGASRNESDFLLPAQEIILGKTLNFDVEEDEELDDLDSYCGLFMGDKPSLLQNDNLGLDDYQFCLQIYGGDFPKGFQDIFYLSDAVGYLFINKAYHDNDAGVFFIQCT